MSVIIQDKIALVTGANRGIGQAIVTSFINHGAKKVYLGVRTPASTKQLEEKYGDKVVTLKMDLNDKKTIVDAANSATDAQIVVNNAGILNLTSVLDDDVEEAFLQEMETNVLGLLRVVKAFAPVIAKNTGAFVQINSVASLLSSIQFSTYSASKAASYSFTQALQMALAEQSIPVLSVHPGPIFSDMSGKTGMNDIAEPPEVVAEGIVKSLEEGKTHFFPDKVAREFESAYQPFVDRYFS